MGGSNGLTRGERQVCVVGVVTGNGGGNAGVVWGAQAVVVGCGGGQCQQVECGELQQLSEDSERGERLMVARE